MITPIGVFSYSFEARLAEIAGRAFAAGSPMQMVLLDTNDCRYWLTSAVKQDGECCFPSVPEDPGD